MRVWGIIIFLFLILASWAQADSNLVTTTLIDTENGFAEPLPDIGTYSPQYLFLSPSAPGIGEIVAVGIKIWNLIVENRTSSEVANDVAHALPSPATSPMELNGWRSGHSNQVTTTFTDPLGSEVARFSYSLNFSYDGKYKNNGHYLADVTIIPENLNVKTFYNMNAQVQVLSALNTGTAAEPTATLKLLLKMKVQDKLLGGEKWASTLFTVDGQGISIAEKSN